MLLPLLCSMSLIYPNFHVKGINFPIFGQGPFPKIAGKNPDMSSKGPGKTKHMHCSNKYISFIF